MTWREGNYWNLELVLQKPQSFEYKYVVVNTNNKHVRWEATPNRVAKEQTNIIMELKDKWEYVT